MPSVCLSTVGGATGLSCLKTSCMKRVKPGTGLVREGMSKLLPSVQINSETKEKPHLQYILNLY